MGFELLKTERPDLWDRFTRREEYENPIRDMYGRFPYWASQERDIFRPSVSEYLYEQGLVNPEYPDGCEFAVCVTHDIDIIYSSPFTKILNGLMESWQGNRKGAFDHFFSATDRKNPFFNFDRILKLEEEYGLTSTWFFQALVSGETEYSYDLADVVDECGAILDSGGEIGLHGGFGASMDYDRLVLEKSRLERVLGEKVIGYRGHFLKFSIPDTWENLSRAGFLYDSTLGYADCVGFRSGMCHPYHPVSLNTQRRINIVEFSLHVMDMTLFKHYMRFDMEKAWFLVQNIIDAVHDCRGVVVVNWHNTSYLDGKFEVQLLERMLKKASEKRAWMGCLSKLLMGNQNARD